MTRNVSHEPTAGQRHRAARALAAHARDADELAELLQMTGLTAAEGRYEPPADAERPEEAREPAADPEETRRLARTLLASYASAR
ncbi:hypothetical protein B0I33_10876 [Prauserella shujinwangii]|uniref:Uncharacterized protein n=1 Tax=Prauserella shujinwangii TaxID=1453103 RepID=A0A2T0LR01_9PSEU|nr:hypothetical protein [Prauserella shujinwangii]PRX45930.1 hypothetical protein B0I33_10876 [Prauserella shujinwangii]